MDPGYIGDTWGKVGEGVSTESWGKEVNGVGNVITTKEVVTYCCVKCGYLESYATKKSEFLSDPVAGLPSCPNCHRHYSQSITMCRYCKIPLKK